MGVPDLGEYYVLVARAWLAVISFFLCLFLFDVAVPSGDASSVYLTTSDFARRERLLSVLRFVLASLVACLVLFLS